MYVCMCIAYIYIYIYRLHMSLYNDYRFYTGVGDWVLSWVDDEKLSA